MPTKKQQKRTYERAVKGTWASFKTPQKQQKRVVKAHGHLMVDMKTVNAAFVNERDRVKFCSAMSCWIPVTISYVLPRSLKGKIKK